MRLRPLLLRLHLWLSLAVGVVFAVAAGTGAILVFQHEIDAWLNRGAVYPVTPGNVGFEAVEGVLRREFPEHRLDLLWFPRWNAPYYEAMLSGRDEPVVVDPGSGALLAPLGERNTFVDTVAHLHTSLLGGDVGYWIVVGTTILSLVILVTGVFLWWPGIRRFFSGFRVRTGRTFYMLSFDLHQVTGILAFPFLLAMCVTGIFMAFPEFANRAVHAAFLRPPSQLAAWNEVRQPPPPAGWTEADRPAGGRLLEAAHREVPGARTFYITYPEGPDEPVHVRLQTGIEPKPFGITSRLAFDQYTGELLQVIDPRRNTLPERIQEEWTHSLHFGDFGGVTSKVLYLLACVVGTGLVVTGFVIWGIKRRRKQKATLARVERRRPLHVG